MPKVKVTVIKRSAEEDLYEKYGHESCEKKCPEFEVGDEFIIDPEDYSVPQDFCPSAWTSISKLVFNLMHGGDIREWEWMKDKNMAIACCTDGLRPVFFKIEKI